MRLRGGGGWPTCACGEGEAGVINCRCRRWTPGCPPPPPPAGSWPTSSTAGAGGGGCTGSWAGSWPGGSAAGAHDGGAREDKDAAGVCVTVTVTVCVCVTVCVYGGRRGPLYVGKGRGPLCCVPVCVLCVWVCVTEEEGGIACVEGGCVCVCVVEGLPVPLVTLRPACPLLPILPQLILTPASPHLLSSLTCQGRGPRQPSLHTACSRPPYT